MIPYLNYKINKLQYQVNLQPINQVVKNQLLINIIFNYIHLFLIFNHKFTIKMDFIKKLILVIVVGKNIKLFKRNFFQ